MDLKECVMCEATGWVYIGFGENDVEECTKCSNGYIKIEMEVERYEAQRN